MYRLRQILFLAGIAIASTALGQSVAPSPILNEGLPATVSCRAQSYVNMTADSEQAIPLQLVATLKCNQEVMIISDPESYTVKVRTLDGKIGYVSHNDVRLKPPSPPAPPPPAQTIEPSATESHGPARMRVFIGDSKTWTAEGGFTGVVDKNSDRLYAGFDPDLGDVYQDFRTICPQFDLTQEPIKADFAVLFDAGNPKKGLSALAATIKPSHLTVIAKGGDTMLTQGAYSTTAAVRNACTTITRYASAHTASEGKQ